MQVHGLFKGVIITGKVIITSGIISFKNLNICAYLNIGVILWRN